jgi:hypothetical protein
VHACRDDARSDPKLRVCTGGRRLRDRGVLGDVESLLMALADFSITPVNPREEQWMASVLFNHAIRFRITLPDNLNWVEKAQARGQFSKAMKGVEGIDWLIDDDHIYCESITFLIMARMTENETFEKCVGRIEERIDNQ